MVYQTITFQGIRYGLFGYNTTQREGGWVDVDAVDVAQPYPRGMLRPIPYGREVQFTAFGRDDGLHGDSTGLGRGVPTSFKVRDMGPVGPVRPRASSGSRRRPANWCFCRSSRTATCASTRPRGRSRQTAPAPSPTAVTAYAWCGKRPGSEPSR